MPLACRSEFLALPSVRLHIRRWGDPAASPVLCIHGAAAHAHWWDHIAPGLLPVHQVIAPDLRGHGASERAAWLALSAPPPAALAASLSAREALGSRILLFGSGA